MNHKEFLARIADLCREAGVTVTEQLDELGDSSLTWEYVFESIDMRWTISMLDIQLELEKMRTAPPAGSIDTPPQEEATERPTAIQQSIDVHIPGTHTRPPMTLRAKHVSTISNPELGRLASNGGVTAVWCGTFWYLDDGRRMADHEFRGLQPDTALGPQEQP